MAGCLIRHEQDSPPPKSDDFAGRLDIERQGGYERDPANCRAWNVHLQSETTGKAGGLNI